MKLVREVLHDATIAAGVFHRKERWSAMYRNSLTSMSSAATPLTMTDTCRVSPADASSIAKTLLRMHSAMAAARSSDTPRRQCPKHLAADTPNRAELPHRYSDHVRHRCQRNVTAVVTEGVVDLIVSVERADPLEFRTGR